MTADEPASAAAESSVLHSRFTLERSYPVPPGRAFAAWAEPEAKARWFAGGAEHTLDFRVGGTEWARRCGEDGQPTLTFEATYVDIVAAERIVYTATLYSDDRPATVSLTTIQFRPTAGGTSLEITELGAFLDGHEQPAWREQGTGLQLSALADELAN